MQQQSISSSQTSYIVPENTEYFHSDDDFTPSQETVTLERMQQNLRHMNSVYF